MSELQKRFGLEPKKRFRKRSIAIQLQQALDDAAASMTADVSVQKLAQTRIDALVKMQAREQNQKLERALSEVKRLTAENEKLSAELAALKPTAPELVSEKVAAMLARAKVTTGFDGLTESKTVKPAPALPHSAPASVVRPPAPVTEQDKKWAEEAAHRAEMQSVIEQLDKRMMRGL